MGPREKAKEVVARLKKAYPDAKIALKFENATASYCNHSFCSMSG